MKERIKEDSVKSLWDYMFSQINAGQDVGQSLLNLGVFMDNKGYRFIELCSKKTASERPNYTFKFRSEVNEQRKRK